MVVCPYNATHHVRTDQEAEHLRDCPDKRVVEIQRSAFTAVSDTCHLGGELILVLP